MSQTFAFYDARADEASAEADKATLDNVRERALRAAKTWRGLADQAQRVETDRRKAEAERTERREREHDEAVIAAQSASSSDN